MTLEDRPARLRRRRRRRQARAVAGAAAVAAAVVLLVVRPWGSTDRPSATAGSAPPRASRPAPSSSVPGSAPRSRAAAGRRAGVPYPVASSSFVVTDSVAGAGTRRVPTTVYYPGVRRGPGAPPDRALGKRPLLVFSEGFDYAPGKYAFLLHHWAAAGFVVAAPAYPDTDPDDGPVDEADILNHPADLRAVVAAVLARAAAPGSPLSGLVAASEVGLVGQSDGGDVTLAAADNDCCRLAGVKAAAVLSGAELVSFGGRYFAGTAVPLLVVQGSADPVNPPACSQQLYDAAPSPKWYLDLVGAGHIPPYVDPVPDRATVAAVTTDFFLAELAHQRGRLGEMVGAGTNPGRTSLTAGGAAPPATGVCPGS